MNNEQIQHLPIFQNLDHSILTKLADHSSLKHYKKYHSFFIHLHLNIIKNIIHFLSMVILLSIFILFSQAGLSYFVTL